MIPYKFEEELQYAIYYANKLNATKILDLLEQGKVASSSEAADLSEFFWEMVNASIEDEKQDVQLPWKEGAEFWNEKIMNTFSGYLEKSGYEKEWDDVFDRQ
ncbi:hypothetical protein [Aliikangiella sp. IMCC44359]|uniref:hypothetical protein n=1 Tax=Aliikangiella sp. IMCC44359 TaxID=3459125 RepID=UPI00403AF895